MAQELNKSHVQEYVYDFSEDGGAVGEIVLSSKAGYKGLPEGAIIEEVIASVETACTSGGSATLSWGNSGDVDGYSGSAKAVGALTADAAFLGGADSAALVPSYVDSTANNQNFSVSIATAALTAGKVHFKVKYMMRSSHVE